MNPWHWVAVIIAAWVLTFVLALALIVRALRKELPPMVPLQVGDTVLMTANGYTRKMRVTDLEPLKVEPWDKEDRPE